MENKHLFVKSFNTQTTLILAIGVSACRPGISGFDGDGKYRGDSKINVECGP